MSFILSDRGIVLEQYGMIELSENLLPVNYGGRKIDRSTTIVFESFYQSECRETEWPDMGLLTLKTLWLCVGFTYGECGIHYLQSSKQAEGQIDEIFEYENRLHGPFERDNFKPFSIPSVFEESHSIDPFIYGIVYIEELENYEEEEEIEEIEKRR